MSLYLCFLLYMSLGFAVSGVLFAWAVKNNQFTGQSRASYFPLEGEEPLGEPGPAAAKRTASFWGTLSIVALSGVLFTAVWILLAFRR